MSAQRSIGWRERASSTSLIAPIGFVVEHVEILYDIDVVFQQQAQKLGLASGTHRNAEAAPSSDERSGRVGVRDGTAGRLAMKRVIIVGGGIAGLGGRLSVDAQHARCGDHA